MRRSFPGSEISGVAADLSTAEGANAFCVQAPDADILVNNVATAFIRDYNGVEDIAKIPDEVANMIIYVGSEQASATSGAALRVDGGVVRFVA